MCQVLTTFINCINSSVVVAVVAVVVVVVATAFGAAFWPPLWCFFFFPTVPLASRFLPGNEEHTFCVFCFDSVLSRLIACSGVFLVFSLDFKRWNSLCFSI